jgi:hypothetical protein
MRRLRGLSAPRQRGGRRRGRSLLARPAAAAAASLQAAPPAGPQHGDRLARRLAPLPPPTRLPRPRRPRLPRPQQRARRARARHPSRPGAGGAPGGGARVPGRSLQAHLQPRRDHHVWLPLRNTRGAAAVRGEGAGGPQGACRPRQGLWLVTGRCLAGGRLGPGPLPSNVLPQASALLGPTPPYAPHPMTNTPPSPCPAPRRAPPRPAHRPPRTAHRPPPPRRAPPRHPPPAAPRPAPPGPVRVPLGPRLPRARARGPHPGG